MDSGKGKIKEYCNIQFYQTLNSKARIKVHQGGTRSGKTYAIVQYLIYKMTTTNDPITISIVRQTLPSLKRSVMRDFISIATKLGIYYKGIHNKADNTFKYNGSTIQFISTDDPQKIRGAKHNICFLNESNELLFESFRQLNMRTIDEMIIDFNPSDPIHWLYNEVIERDDCDLFITTYKDNKFLPSELVKEIERIKDRDPDYWRVYGQGQRAVFSQRQIFSNWKSIPFDQFPQFDEITLGLDFGFTNDPAAILSVGRIKDKLFVHELLYKKGMTNRDISNFLKENKLDQTLCYCDSAEPKSIEELRQMGILAKGAIKGPGSISAGISMLKEFEIFISNESTNLKREQYSYYWQQLKDNTIINKPIDKNNHLIDSLRYCVYSKFKNRTDFFVI
ncbi:MAG: putative terminase large subunit [Prokaryotic dsDNA virus sp.]|nr:MAG: putative terminase large subunit [Prokaryotic dsDNA virus sp.]|tara:strand:- start:838 stop:2016 length:1179 start_codon:yes stop_codon:yes gene_type:complete